MKVLVIGSSRDLKPLKKAIDNAAHLLGLRLAERGHSILVGSDDPVDVDPHVVEGAMDNGKKRASVEIHVPHGMGRPFEGLETNPDVDFNVVWHQFPDWDVTSMETIRTVDAVLAIGGRKGVIQAGVSAWMLGVPIVPVAWREGLYPCRT